MWHMVLFSNRNRTLFLIPRTTNLVSVQMRREHVGLRLTKSLTNFPRNFRCGFRCSTALLGRHKIRNCHGCRVWSKFKWPSMLRTSDLYGKTLLIYWSIGMHCCFEATQLRVTYIRVLDLELLKFERRS